MDTPPAPKPRSAFLPQNDGVKRPVPLPRTKVPISANDRVSASDIFRSISTVSKQITEDMASKVSSSAKTANEKIEKSIQDGSKFAKGTLEKTINTSRSVRDTVTKSVIEGTRSAGLKLRKTKKSDDAVEGDSQRCVSMPVVDVSLFDNIQFHSPLLEQKRCNIEDNNLQNNHMPSLQLNSSNLDNLSLISSNSDSTQNDYTTFLDSNSSTYDTPRSSRQNSIISSASTSDIAEIRKKANFIEVLKMRALREVKASRESRILQSQKGNKTSKEAVERPSKSTIYEFDPLNAAKTVAKYEGVSNELLLLESFLISDTHGTIVSTESNEGDFDASESEYFNLPTPPERSDSLLPNESCVAASSSRDTEKDKSTNWYVSGIHENKTTSDETRSQSVMRKFSHMLKLDGRKSLKPQVQKPVVVERPAINNLNVLYYSGMLTKIVSGVVEDLFKNSQMRYCVLFEQKLLCYTDPTNSILKEAYTLDSINSVQIALPSNIASNSYCFELSVSMEGVRGNPRKVLFSCLSASERGNWAQKIAEHLTPVFPTKFTSEYTRCGWCYLKEGVLGEWRGAWLMLIRRVLIYSCNTDSGIRCVDLRKARNVVLQVPSEDINEVCPCDCSHNLLLDCPLATVYLRFPYERELKAWLFMIKLAAHNNGSYLHHQQLTKEDVPTIVDKCIKFIYAHGSLSEGIYRRTGSSVALAELLAQFRKDAWSVQLDFNKHTEHDVAGVLKRFFRDLPEPLIPQDRHPMLIAALELDDESARYAEFRRTFASLSVVGRNTARKLFGHLHFLQTMAHANKMNAENLASVWAPTIMPAEMAGNTLQTAWSSKEASVVRELIANYEQVWRATEAEREREAAVRDVLGRVHTSAAPAAPRSAGDLRAWVYVHSRNDCYQIALSPNKTSADLCIELCEKAKMESHLLMLEEVICNESMRRIVHLDEVVLDVVLRWGYWDEEDRKDNYLLVKENKILQEMEALRHSTSLVCGELRLANEASKTFKPHMFEFNQTKLSYFKDKQGSHKFDEWDIKNILWYIGHEPKRNPQSRWSITFIPKDNKSKRSKERPWFGCTIAGAVTEDQLKWMTAMMFAEHANILPTPRLVIT